MYLTKMEMKKFQKKKIRKRTEVEDQLIELWVVGGMGLCTALVSFLSNCLRCCLKAM